MFSLMLTTPYYNERFKALPDVRGLAQVKLSSHSKIRGIEHKTFLDRKYTRDASLRLDLPILFPTATLCFGLQRKISQRLWLELPFNFSQNEVWASHQDMNAKRQSWKGINPSGTTSKQQPEPSRTNV